MFYGFIVFSMKDLYYNSYNFPTFAVTWDWNTFLLTTVVPFVLLVGITALGLVRHMSATPLQFLRHEAQRRRTRRNLRLPELLPFNSRFRLRLFARNLPNYAVLFFGLSLASLLLLFGMSVLPTMNKYADMLSEDMVAQHQYVLKVPLKIDGTDQERETFSQIEEYLFGDRDSFSKVALLKLAAKAKPYEGDDAVYVNTAENSQEAIEQAERFCAYTFETPRALVDSNEEITLYGVEPDSAYWQGIDVGEGKFVITPGIAEKCGLAVGDTMELIDKYHAKTYEVTVSGTWGNSSTMAVYMSMDDFNELLGNASTYFNGYVSNMPLNFNARYVASEVTPASMQAVADQMTDSMGGMMQMLLFVAVVIYFVLMYLLTKTVIDRAARSISYMKVFGYRDAEISRLYVRSITVTVLASLVACLPLIIAAVLAVALIGHWAFNLLPAYEANLSQADTVAAADLQNMGPAWYYNGLAVIAMLVGSLLVADSAYLVVRGVRARMNNKGESLPRAIAGIVTKTPAQTGGYLTHLGLGIVLIGLVGSAMYITDRTYIFNEGDTARVGAYTLKLTDATEAHYDEQNNRLSDVTVEVSKGGQVIDTLNPALEWTAKSYYGQTFVTACTVSNPFEDLFVSYQGYSSSGYIVNARINPMISLVWAGFIVMTIGIVCAAAPKRSSIKDQLEVLPGGAGEQGAAEPAEPKE